MRTLTYWLAAHPENKAYSLRATTRKELKQKVADAGNGADYYAKPRKVVVRYTSPLDLLDTALGEGGVE